MISNRCVWLLVGTAMFGTAGCVVDEDEAAQAAGDTTVVAVPVGVPVTDTVTVTDTVRDTINTVTPIPVPIPVPVDTSVGQRRGGRADTGAARTDTIP